MPDVYDVLATPIVNVYDVLTTLRVYDVLATDTYMPDLSLALPKWLGYAELPIVQR